MEKVIIYSQNNEGVGICKVNGITTFVPFALTNDECNIEVIEKHKNYNVGKLINIEKESDERQAPKCPYYYKCGGCNIMHQSYQYQLKFKKNKVINNLKHICNIDIDNIEIISDNEFNYRNHVVLKIDGNKMGFYQSHTNDIIDIEECIISNDRINKSLKQIRTFINKYSDHSIKSISIKAYKEVLLNIESINFKYINEFSELVEFDSLFINNKYVSGRKSVEEVLGDKTYKITSATFFQKNTNMTIKLYDYIKSLINNETVLDLYCGCGSIGIYITENATKVLGIEVIKDAVDNAIENKIINNIKNIDFKVGKVEKSINNNYKFDTIILDPPRVGLNKNAIKDIININAKKIIYVSCNSTTLARDINLLKDTYKVVSVKLFDLFPNTHHVESVLVLCQKGFEK